MKTNSLQTLKMNVVDNELYLGKYKISDLGKEYNTPLYVFDENHLRAKLDLYKEHFKDNDVSCRVVYASKAFFAPYLLDILNEYNMMIDSVSMGDLMMIEHAHFDFSKVVLHGNYKKEEELEFAINKGVGYLVADSLEELKKIDLITRKLNKDIHVLLRINSGVEAHTHEYMQTAKLNSKFGESIYDFDLHKKFIDICKKNSLIHFDGYHSHIGSSISEASSFSEASKVMLDFIGEIEKRNGITINTLNLGGGFGIKYLEDDKMIDIKEMVTNIVFRVKEYNDKGLHIKNILIEPGRSIVGDSSFTIYRCGGTKKSYGGKTYVFADGGMTDNIRPALYGAKYHVDNASNMNGNKVLVDVVGPCCESGDVVRSDIYLQEAKDGDYLVTYCTGAYCYAMSSNYNGAIRSATIFVRDDEVKVAVNRESYNDLSKSFSTLNDIRKHKVFDCHCDVLYDLWTRKAQGVKNRFKDYHVNQLKNSSIGGALWTMYSEFDFNLIEACKIALEELKEKEKLLPNFPVILGLEGLRNVHEISELDTLYDMGFRHAMVTWNEENKWATGAKSNPERGFTEDGIKLLKHMEEKGMIIDLAHTNEKSFYDALKVVKKNIIYSHGLCKAFCSHPRNLTDAQLKALKEVDGLFGITLANSFISENEENRTFDMFKKHVKHAINIMGVDNICFGFDFMDYLSEFPNSNLIDVSDATFSYRIIDMLEEMGYNNEEIDKMCYKNFFDRYGHLVHEF